jgi:hypothetical protein
MKQLKDQELDQLLAAVLAEQGQRGRKLPTPDESSRKRQVNAVEVPLTLGKLNAVRAAFKAGVRPSQIARQFGISQLDVRKVLAMDAAVRVSSSQPSKSKKPVLELFARSVQTRE